MYQALYRVWRPRTFSDMVGQEAVVRTLRNQIETGHIAHAYLFCGSRGTGKTSAAKIMSRAVNCEHPVNGDPCGECDSCKAILSETSLDVYEMDAASNSKVEEMRDLLEKVAYPPQFSKYKVYIIDEVHMLSTNAFNALLKTLEEPPEYMVFILATTEPQKIPATILSRCQRYDFGRFTEGELCSRMETILKANGRNATEEALQLIAQAAEGGMRDALSILDMCMSGENDITGDSVRAALGSADAGFLFKFADAIAEKNQAAGLRNCDELMRSGRDVGVFLKDFSRHLRNLSAVQICGPDVIWGGERYVEQSKKFTTPRLMRLMDAFLKAQSDTRWASSARSVLEICTLRCCQEEVGADNAALLERLAEMEKKVKDLEQNGVRVSAKAVRVRESAEGQEAQPSGPAPEEEIIDDPSPSDKTPKEIWNDAVAYVKKSFPMQYSFLVDCTYGGYKDNTFEAVYPVDKKGLLFMMNEQGIKNVETALRESGGGNCSFRVRPKEDPNAAKKAKAREEMVEKNLQQLVDTFGRDKVIVE